MADMNQVSTSHEVLRRIAIKANLDKASNLMVERTTKMKQLYLLETLMDKPENMNLNALLSNNLYEEEPGYSNYRKKNGFQLISSDVPAEIGSLAQNRGVVLIPPKSTKTSSSSSIIPNNSHKTVDTTNPPPPATAIPSQRLILPSSIHPPTSQQNHVNNFVKELPVSDLASGDVMKFHGVSHIRNTSGQNYDVHKKASPALKSSLAKVPTIINHQANGIAPLSMKHKKLKLLHHKLNKDVPEEIRGYRWAAWKSLVHKKPVSTFMQTASKSLTTKDWQVAREEQKHFKLLSRIETLEKEGLWSFKQRRPHEPPRRLKSHHDLMMDEMRWMSQDFRQERKWKIAMCSIIARWVMGWHNAEDRLTVCVNTGRSAHEMMDLDFLTPHSTRRSISIAKDEFNSSNEDTGEISDAVIGSIPSVAEDQALKGRDTEIRWPSINSLQLDSITSQYRLNNPFEALKVHLESLVYVVPVTPITPPIVKPPIINGLPSSSTSIISSPHTTLSSTLIPPVEPAGAPDLTTRPTSPPPATANGALATTTTVAALTPQTQLMPQNMLNTLNFLYSPFDATELHYDPMPYHNIIPVTSLMNKKYIVEDINRYDQYGTILKDGLFDDEPISTLPGNELYHQDCFDCSLFGSKKLKEEKTFEPQPSASHNDPNRSVPPWTAEEEDMLMVLVAQYPGNWDLIADNLTSARLGPPKAIRNSYECFVKWGRASKEQRATVLGTANESASIALPPQSPVNDIPTSPLSPTQLTMTRKQKLESQHLKLLRKDEQKRIKRYSAVYDLMRQYAEQREASKALPAKPPRQINLAAHETHQQSQVQAGVSLENPPLTPLQLGQLKERRDKEIRNLHEASRMMARPPGAPLMYGQTYPNYRLARPGGSLPSAANGSALRPPGQSIPALPPAMAAQVVAAGGANKGGLTAPLSTNLLPANAARPMSQADLNRILMPRQQPMMQRPILGMTHQQRQAQAALIAALPPAQRQMFLMNLRDLDQYWNLYHHPKIND